MTYTEPIILPDYMQLLSDVRDKLQRYKNPPYQGKPPGFWVQWGGCIYIINHGETGEARAYARLD